MSPRWAGAALGLIGLAVVSVAWDGLTLPFFWDELGVYGRQSLWQYDHGLSLHPGSMHFLLTRGHPLLLSAIYGAWMHVFGPSVVSQHSLALITSLLLLATLARIAWQDQGPFWAVIAVLLFACQPLFLAQSVMVLPEIPLALFVLLGLRSYERGRWFFYILWATCAILVKETAIVLPAAIGFSELIGWIREKNQHGRHLLRCVWAGVPALALLLFWAVQKAALGWALWPYHTDLMVPASAIPLEIWGTLKMLFKPQGRWAWLILLLASLAVLLVRNPAGSSNSTTNNFRDARTRWLLIGIGVVVCAMNFRMERYLLFLMAIVLLEFIHWAANASRTAAWLRPLALVLALVPLFYIGYGDRGDTNLDYRDAVRKRRAFTEKLAVPLLQDKRIWGFFPASWELSDARLGYFDAQSFNVLDEHTPQVAELFYFTRPGSLDFTAPDTSQMILIAHQWSPEQEESLWWRPRALMRPISCWMTDINGTFSKPIILSCVLRSSCFYLCLPLPSRK